LQAIANLASIATALVAVSVWWRITSDSKEKRKRLENYLKAEKEAGGDQGQRTVLHLVVALGLSETEIMNAAFRSKCIARTVSADMLGTAAKMFLSYQPNAKSAPTPI
jgi:pyrroloquinoline quinone (PQQ) biosynthesis protein C